MGQASSKQIYKPLNEDRKEIRVLHVLGPRTGGLLRANLHLVSLDSEPEYEAISYCWAEAPGEDYMMLNGMIWKAPASAVKVLHQFQPEDEGFYRVLWIDALCINQVDIPERGCQVQMMGDIYRGCEQALIWLGDHDESVDRAIESVHLLLADVGERTSEFETDLEAWEGGAWQKDPEEDDLSSRTILAAGFNPDALSIFLQRPWFTRLWVLQEACLAPAALCYSGDSRVGWRALCCAVTWYSEKHGSILNSSLFTNELPMSAHAVLRFSWRFIEHQNRIPSNDCVAKLLPIAGYLDASEPLDRAFAILGLSDLNENRRRWPEAFCVDYSQPYGKTMACIYRAAMAHSSELSLLIWAGLSTNKPNESLRAPSWIPDWNESDEAGHTRFWAPFTADGGQPFSFDDMLNAQPPETLVLAGLSLGVITNAMPTMEFDVLRNTRGFRQNFKASVAFLQSSSELGTDEASAIQYVARTLSVGGCIPVAPDNRAIAEDDEDFKHGLSAFLQSEDADGDEVKIKNPWTALDFDFSAYAMSMSHDKRLFRTSKGYIGVGPATTEPGDVVSILSGGRVPFVLRPEPSDESLEGSRFILNGECYIHGIMFGEAVQEHKQAGLPFSTFNLV